MKLEISYVESGRQWRRFREFLQELADILAIGYYRYGSPHPGKKYMTRIGLELAAYRRTGNRAHLINIANYCWLETQAPENPRFHWGMHGGSVTRRRLGGER